VVCHPDLHDSLIQQCDASLFFISPGRFFAVNEIKVLVARILMTYDIKLAEGSCVPHDRRMGTFRVVQTTDVFFRRRQT
jgi:hypothetical protein